MADPLIETLAKFVDFMGKLLDQNAERIEASIQQSHVGLASSLQTIQDKQQTLYLLIQALPDTISAAMPCFPPDTTIQEIAESIEQLRAIVSSDLFQLKNTTALLTQQKTGVNQQIESQLATIVESIKATTLTPPVKPILPSSLSSRNDLVVSAIPTTLEGPVKPTLPSRNLINKGSRKTATEKRKLVLDFYTHNPDASLTDGVNALNLYRDDVSKIRKALRESGEL